MATIATLLSENNTNITSKTTADSITPAIDGAERAKVLDEIKVRGIKSVVDTTALSAVSGADFRNIIVTDNGVYEWLASGTANGTTIFAASGGGVWSRVITPNVNNAFTALSGTSWDGSNKYKTSLSGNLALTLNSTKVAGLLVIEDNNSHTLTINGTSVSINATTPTVIGFTKANGIYYVIDKDGLTVQVSGADITAPTFTFEAIDANTFRGTASKSMGTVSIAGFSFKQNGSTITPNSVSGATIQWDFVVSETLLNTDTFLWDYDSSTGATVDLAGNELATATDQSVTNSIPGSVQAINWTDEINTTDAGSGTLNGNNSTTPAGARATKKMVGDGYVKFNIGSSTNGEALVLCLSATNTTNYALDLTTTIGAIYYFGTTIYINNGSGEAINGGSLGSYVWLRIDRVGDDLIYKASDDDVTYTTLATQTGKFTGITDVFIKTQFGVNSATKSMVTAKGTGLITI